MKIRVLPFLLLLSLATTALAEQVVDETRAVADDGVIDVKIIAGSIAVVAGGSGELRVAGTLGDEVEELEIRTSGRRTVIEPKLPDRKDLEDVDVKLEITVPRSVSLEIKAVSAPVTVDGIEGPVVVEVVSGDVTVEGGSAELEVATVSGTIDVATSAPVEDGDLKTVSGKIVAEVDLASRGRLSAKAVSGRIVLRVPASISADFDVQTFSGAIRNDLGPRAKTFPYGPGQTLSFTTGDGDASVVLNSFSGSVSIQAR